MQEAKETKNVQDVAQQLQAKATAAYSAEIAAVASPEEAGMLLILHFHPTRVPDHYYTLSATLILSLQNKC